MKEELKQYSSTIRKKHVIAWSPKYQESIHTDLGGKRLIAVILEVISDLGWLIHYRNETEIVVQTKVKFNRYEVIRISFSTGKIEVESRSTGNAFWDMGRNSKWVKLFAYAFTSIEKSYSKTDLKDLEEGLIKQDNWDDYEIPNQLPKPVKRIKPTFWIPLIGGLVIAICIAFTFAKFTSVGRYIIFLFDVLTGLTIGYTIKYLIRWGNYIEGDRLTGLVIVTSVLSFCFYQYFSFLFIDIPFSNVGFIDFITNRFNQGVEIESIQLGSWAVALQWGIQLVLPMIIAYLLMVTSLINYIAERVPQEVVDFAYYHFLKNKTESQVRNELIKMGWVTKECQDEVFMAIEAIKTSVEMKSSMV